MTTCTDKPSIAELQRMCARDTFTDEGAIIEAVPVLLEIAAAALALRKAAAVYSESGWLSDDNPLFKQVDAAHRDYDDALNKVRP